MSSTISPTTAAMPCSMHSATTDPVAPTTGGGPVPIASTAQLTGLVQAIGGLVDALNGLVAVLQGQQGVPAAGAATTTAGGAAAAPEASAISTLAAPAASTPARSAVAPAPAPAAAPASASAAVGTVDPSTVKDKDSTNGLKPAAVRGLEEAHRFGIPLVSGHRDGGASTSDHPKGLAIDVSTLKIGAASSTGGTPQMQAYAEYMREQGKAGKLDVKYVIHNGQIASARNDWAWRTYTYPGKSAAEMEALRQSNRGEYNRMQHYDHVHVSFDG